MPTSFSAKKTLIWWKNTEIKGKRQARYRLPARLQKSSSSLWVYQFLPVIVPKVLLQLLSFEIYHTFGNINILFWCISPIFWEVMSCIQRAWQYREFLEPKLRGWSEGFARASSPALRLTVSRNFSRKNLFNFITKQLNFTQKSNRCITFLLDLSWKCGERINPLWKKWLFFNETETFGRSSVCAVYACIMAIVWP